MRAALLETEWRIAVTEVDPPTIQSADQVLIRVRTVGVWMWYSSRQTIPHWSARG